MAYSGELNNKQKALLEQFKVNVRDILIPEYDDEYLLKWIRAREWDLKKAEKMLRDSLEWRKSFGTDTIFDWNAPEVLKKYYPGGWLGHDKEGIPIWYEVLGYVDLKGVLFSATKKDIVRFKIQTTEHLVVNICSELSKKFNKRIDKCIFILDMEGIGLKHLWKPAVDVYSELLSTVELNYPETLQTCYVVNAPSIFPLLYACIKPFLAEYTRSKIRVLGSDWKQQLLKDIDADQIPVHWGGTLTDPDGDPYCRSKICMGGTVPETYRLKNLSDNVDMSQFTKIVVERGSSVQVETQVSELGTLLRWNFWTDHNDIGFGVYRKTLKGKQKVEDMEVIVETTRVNSHMVPEADSIQCTITGTYVIRFDNTYSWINGKKVSYLIELLAPVSGAEVEQMESTYL